MSDYTADSPDRNVLIYRVSELARTVRDLTTWRREVDVERERIRNASTALEERVAELQQSVDSLRRTLLGFAFTIAGSAIVFSLSVLIATGKIGGG